MPRQGWRHVGRSRREAARRCAKPSPSPRNGRDAYRPGPKSPSRGHPRDCAAGVPQPGQPGFRPIAELVRGPTEPPAAQTPVAANRAEGKARRLQWAEPTSTQQQRRVAAARPTSHQQPVARLGRRWPRQVAAGRFLRAPPPPRYCRSGLPSGRVRPRQADHDRPRHRCPSAQPWHGGRAARPRRIKLPPSSKPRSAIRSLNALLKQTTASCRFCCQPQADHLYNIA